MLTGEPVPVTKRVGDQVIGATMNMNGSLVMRSEKVGHQLYSLRSYKWCRKLNVLKLQCKEWQIMLAGWFVMVVIGISILTFLGWGIFGPEPSWVYGLINAVAVLIIACPCALGLATPMSIMVATGRGASNGVLFRDAAAIENLRKIDTLIIDKTGTLTEGQPHLIRLSLFLDMKITRFFD
jgi:Cu+-exporting ATPase